MRNLRELDRYRLVGPDIVSRYGSSGDETCGAFQVGRLRILASSEGGWDHVSVSTPNRCPTWEEMEKVKRLFFRDDETAMQLHVPVKEHVNYHPYCLHLWRNQNFTLPLPPRVFVGPG